MWWHNLPSCHKSKEVRDFLFFFCEGHLPSTESCRRARQLIQAENPELRGEKYQDRQNKSREVARAMRECPGYGEVCR